MPPKGAASRAGHSLLSAIAGLNRLINVRIYSGSQFVASGASAIFAKSTQGIGAESVVVGWYYLWQADDYQTSPIKLVPFSAQGQTTVASEVLTDPFVMRCPEGGMWLPPPYGVRVRDGRGVGLQITNGEAAGFLVEGWIAVATWEPDAADESPSSAAPWGKVFG